MKPRNFPYRKMRRQARAYDRIPYMPWRIAEREALWEKIKNYVVMPTDIRFRGLHKNKE